jgi:Flp pilus assembly protein TadD
VTSKWTVSPSHDELTFLLEAGVIYRDGKNFAAAQDVFNGVRALLPKHELPEILLGTVDFQQGNFDGAASHYRKAIELNPRSAFAYAHLGEVFLFRKNKEDARSNLKTAISLDPLGEYGKMARKLMELTDQVKFV